MQEHVSQEIGRLEWFFVTAAGGEDEEGQEGKAMMKC